MKVRLTLILVAIVAWSSHAWSQAKTEEKDPVLKLSQVPQKVQQAIQAYATPVEIKEITKGDVDGKTAYEFAIEKNGRKSEVAIAPDGKVLTEEAEVTLQEVPEAARKAMDARATGGKIISTEKAVEGGATTYAAVVEKNGKQSEFTFAPDGKLVGSEEDISPAEVPEAARKTISAKAAGGKIVSTRKVLEDGKTVYAVVIEKGGRQTEITVAADGKVVDSEEIKG